MPSKRNELNELNELFRHAEHIGQIRLNNFLMTGTILLVGCGVALQADETAVGSGVSVVLSYLGIIFSLIWYNLGSRQRKFHGCIEGCIDGILKNTVHEQEIKSFWTTQKVREFQRRNEDDNENHLKPSTNEIRYSSRRLLTVVPKHFSLAYILVLILSLLKMRHDLIDDHDLCSTTSWCIILIISFILIAYTFYMFSMLFGMDKGAKDALDIDAAKYQQTEDVIDLISKDFYK